MSDLELDEIQGNVLRAYGLRHAAFVFVLLGSAAHGRRLISDLAGEVTTAARWQADRKVLDATLNVAVTAGGLRALGQPEAVLESFPPEFLQGMATRAEVLLGDTGPSHPERWEHGPGAHVLITVHARDAAALREQLQRLLERIERRRAVLAGQPQLAALLPAGDDYGREHFGYNDGFAQPAIRGGVLPMHPGEGIPRFRGWRPLAAGEFVLGYPDEQGVVADGPATPLGRNSTFMVYRKLRQDVALFRRVIREAAQTDFSDDAELVAAKIVGRWRDGTPLALSPHRSDPALAADRERTNDFRYAADPGGERCPLGAHIRRANPRDSLFGGPDRTRRHRILRRGMPYGPALPPDAPDDGADRGLLFICFNASIVRQFETVNRWLIDGNVFGVGRDRDFLLGANEEQAGKMTIEGAPPRFLSPLRPLVITRGGEYLFLPSVTALRSLAALREPAHAV